MNKQKIDELFDQEWPLQAVNDWALIEEGNDNDTDSEDS